jgi:DNA-binding response OmpR family regulator
MRLLVIEDEPRIIEILKSALPGAGFVADFVSLCADGRVALASHPSNHLTILESLAGFDGTLTKALVKMMIG